MAKRKKHLDTAYQRHLDLLRATGLFLLAGGVIGFMVIAWLLNRDQYTEATFYFFVAAFWAFIAGIAVSVTASIKQNVADAVNEHLYAVWKYKPETVYNFYRKMCRHEKKTRFFNFLAASAVCLVLGLIMFFNTVSHYLGIIVLFAAALLFVIAVISLPYSQYLLLKLRTKITGDAKEIIFSRSGIWYCGKVCYFGDKAVTYHRVERKELYGQDAIVFYYTKTRGFSQTAMALAIPVAPKMAYAADELVNEFNRSDLLESKR